MEVIFEEKRISQLLLHPIRKLASPQGFPLTPPNKRNELCSKERLTSDAAVASHIFQGNETSEAAAAFHILYEEVELSTKIHIKI